MSKADVMKSADEIVRELSDAGFNHQPACICARCKGGTEVFLLRADVETIQADSQPQWQPISEAPKDGTEILGWRDHTGVMLVRWTCPDEFCTESECEKLGESAEQYDWFCADFVHGSRLEGDCVPTHFMPLPNPPKA